MPTPSAEPDVPTSGPGWEDERVTVVVMSRDRRADLLRTLPRHRAPVVLVDNHSTDGTVPAVRRALPHVEVVALRGNEGAYARTLGVRQARTPFVAFADDDSWWAPGALTRAAQILAEHPSAAVVNARILVGPQERLDPVCEVMARSPLAVHPSGYPRLLGFVACGAMVRRAAFEAVGGFDRVVRFPGEEERVALDLVGAGWDLLYADDVVVHHHPSSARHSTARRTRAVTRSAVLTGVLRRPWRVVLTQLWRHLTAGGPRRRGAVDALLELPRAVRHRRTLSPAVLAAVRSVELVGEGR